MRRKCGSGYIMKSPRPIVADMMHDAIKANKKSPSDDTKEYIASTASFHSSEEQLLFT